MAANKLSSSERDPLFSASYTKGDTFTDDTNQNASYSSCTQQLNVNNDAFVNPSKSNINKPTLISLHHIILLQIGQIFNYLQSKSYKIYSGFIHSDLGISYKILTYTVFVSGYVSIINLLTSKYYNRLPCNVFISFLFFLSALSALLLYYFYASIFIIFLSRPLLTLSTMAMWNYVLSLIINCIPKDVNNDNAENKNRNKRTFYMSWWNSAYPISTFFLVITGVIIHNLSYFDYLLYSAIIAISISIICLLILPKFTIYSLSNGDRNHKENIDKQMEQNIVYNMFDICSNNKLFITMMIIAAMDSMILSIMNLLIGPYLKDNYLLNPQQLGIYVTITIGIGELITSAVIVPFVATKSRFHFLIFAGATIEFLAIIGWNIIHVSGVPPLPITLVIILFIYSAHEWLFCGIMFKNQQVANKSQQVILTSFWSVIITISSSCGNIMIGELYGITGGVKIVLMIVGCLSASAWISSCALCYFQWKKRRQIHANENGIKLDKV